MTFGYDAEAVYQDADIEQAEFEAQAAAIAAARRRGICSHGSQIARAERVNRSRVQIEAIREFGHFPDRATDARITCQDDIPAGMALCVDCGELVEDPFAARR